MSLCRLLRPKICAFKFVTKVQSVFSTTKKPKYVLFPGNVNQCNRVWRLGDAWILGPKQLALDIHPRHHVVSKASNPSTYTVLISSVPKSYTHCKIKRKDIPTLLAQGRCTKPPLVGRDGKETSQTSASFVAKGIRFYTLVA